MMNDYKDFNRVLRSALVGEERSKVKLLDMLDPSFAHLLISIARFQVNTRTSILTGGLWFYPALRTSTTRDLSLNMYSRL